MVDNRMLRQVQALASSDVRLGVGAGCLTCWAGEGRLRPPPGRRTRVRPCRQRDLLRVGGERDDVLAQPRELLGQGSVLAQPPVEEERLEAGLAGASDR